MSENAIEYLRDEAEKSRNLMGAKLAKSRMTEQEIMGQIETLKAYRKEYRGKMQRAMLEGTSLHLMRDFQRFLASLDQSIGSANSYLANQRSAIQVCQQKLQELQREASSFGALVKRRKVSRVETLKRQEIKEQDALAAQVYMRKIATGTNTTVD